MLMFIETNSSFIKAIFLIGYFVLLLYAFGKGKEIRIRRKEKAFRKKLYSILETENLPLYKGENTVNWSKVYIMLKDITPSPERDEVMEIVRAKKNARKR
ncbi:MAG: hypothetical protein VR72_07075 [Clostridiaceae bacterium BRH_c20a]|nr:MAG: hypothetical protein VR72_07075 [Clostridiaceae bacterium BRH_c20a]